MFCYWSKRIHIYQPFCLFNVVNIIFIQLYAGLCRKTTGTTIRGGCSGICPSLVSRYRGNVCADSHLNHAALSVAAGRKRRVSEPLELQLLAAHITLTSGGARILSGD